MWLSNVIHTEHEKSGYILLRFWSLFKDPKRICCQQYQVMLENVNCWFTHVQFQLTLEAMMARTGTRPHGSVLFLCLEGPTHRFSQSPSRRRSYGECLPGGIWFELCNTSKEAMDDVSLFTCQSSHSKVPYNVKLT